MNSEVETLLDRAAPLSPEDRIAFLAKECLDPLVRADVEALLREADEAECCFDAAIQGVAASLQRKQEPAHGDRIGSYRILSLIGSGGMGNVYLAERADGEIQHKVAVKVLRADGHLAGWRERFLNERQLLASLHHPSVVHVIDAGHTEDGRPYLVMEHVEGVPIDRYAAGIEVKERLKLFLKVCAGVAHAHRHLIIHRDLKPSNILVDATGEAKLLDFGIAKLVNEQTSDVTQPGEQLLTPNYASPEQVRGETQTTATDVYSLGAVLYKMLTGAAPRDQIRGKGEKEVAPPSETNPEIPHDLDFVVRKALRPEAEERYVSVDEFASDVRAALERRPVQARAGDVWYRVRRNLRRNWMPVAAALLVVGSLAAGLGVAIHERGIAERRFSDVRQLANKLFDIDVQVAQLPGASKTRQLIVNTALEYLKRVTVEARMEPGLALELGTAYMRVARVQGVNISANLGQTQQADQTEEKAQALIHSVLAVQPRNRQALLRAGQIAHDRMILAGDGDRNADALRFARISVDRVNEYLKAGPLDASSDRLEAQQVIITLINVANRYMRADQFDEAIRTAGRAIEIAHATNWPTQAGAALMIVALAHRWKGELDEALLAVRESVRLLEPAAGESRSGRLITYAMALTREGQILGEDQSVSLARTGEAVASLQRSLEISRKFADRDPSDFQSQQMAFSAETKLANIVRYTDPVRALGLYDEGLRRMAGVSANAGTSRSETETLAASIYPLLQLGRRAEARKRLDAALEHLRALKQYPADQISLGSAADDTLRASAEYEANGGDVKGGAARYQELLRLVSAANPQPKSSLEDAVELSNLYAAAARLHRRAGQTHVANDLETRRVELWQHWVTRFPNNGFARRQLDGARRWNEHSM